MENLRDKDDDGRIWLNYNDECLCIIDKDNIRIDGWVAHKDLDEMFNHIKFIIRDSFNG